MRYRKTELGLQLLKDRSGALTPRQRSAFILFDGTRSAEDVVQATAALGITAADITHMVELGMLAPVGGTAAAAPATAAPRPAVATAAQPPAAQTAAERDEDTYEAAYQIATQLTAGLGLGGLRLNLAVEAASDLEQLMALAPRIRKAVGDDKCLALDRILQQALR